MNNVSRDSAARERIEAAKAIKEQRLVENRRLEAKREEAASLTFVRVKIKQVMRDDTLYRIVRVKKIQGHVSSKGKKGASGEAAHVDADDFDEVESENLLKIPITKSREKPV